MQVILKKWEPALHALAFLLVIGPYVLRKIFGAPSFELYMPISLVYAAIGCVFILKYLKTDQAGFMRSAACYMLVGGVYAAMKIITISLNETVFYHG